MGKFREMLARLHGERPVVEPRPASRFYVVLSDRHEFTFGPSGYNFARFLDERDAKECARSLALKYGGIFHVLEHVVGYKQTFKDPTGVTAGFTCVEEFSGSADVSSGVGDEAEKWANECERDIPIDSEDMPAFGTVEERLMWMRSFPACRPFFREDDHEEG